MNNDITPERISNSIKLDSTFNGVHLIVEGPSDQVLFGKFIDQEKCQITIAFGSFNVIESIKILNGDNFQKKLGVIDTDFRKLIGEEPQIENLLLTDYHDIEIAIYQSNAFETVLSLYYQKFKCNDFEKQKGKTIREIILERAQPLGYLKLINKKHGLGLSFKPKNPEGRKLDYSKFISKDGLEFLGVNELIQTVINYSLNKGSQKLPTKEDIEKLLKDEMKNEHDILHLCNGHDLISIVSLSLKRVIGNQNSSQCNHEQLQNDFILAFDSKYFELTKLYLQMKDWESKNHQFLKA